MGCCQMYLCAFCLILPAILRLLEAPDPDLDAAAF